jgi:hypothetical protein
VKSEDGPRGAEYTYGNTWNYRNTKRNRLGDMGQGAAVKKGLGFIDDNGDGINDLAPDHDGDGVPNGQDSDWVRNKRDGIGYQHGQRMRKGINDLAPDHDGDGVPNGQDSDWIRHKRDGTGYQHGQRMRNGGSWHQGSQSRGGRGGRATR